MSWLDPFLEAYNTVQSALVPLVQRKILNFNGAGVTVVDNPTNRSTDVTIGSAAPVRKSSAYAGQLTDGVVLANTSGGGWTYSFPTGMADGYVVRLKDPNPAATGWTTNHLTLQAQAGQKIENPYENGTFSSVAGTQSLSSSGGQEFMWGQTEGTWFAI